MGRVKLLKRDKVIASMKLRQKLSVLALKLLHKTIKKQKKIKIYDKVFILLPNVFSPRGTFTSSFLARNLGVRKGDYVLDLGTGCGIQAVFAAEKAEKVVATDINPQAVKCAKINAKINGVAEKIDVRCGNLFEPVKNEKFDLIIFSPPYLPGKPKSYLEHAWLCGEKYEMIREFFHYVKEYLKPGGRIRMVYSTIADVSLLFDILKENRFTWFVVASMKTPLERIFILEIKA